MKVDVPLKPIKETKPNIDYQFDSMLLTETTIKN